MIYRHIILVACSLVLLGTTSANHAEEPRLLPRAGVLVLRNGSVLEGKILRVGDRYVVGLSERDEVVVPADRVEMECDSLTEAYQRKQKLLGADATVRDHLRLADWCLQNDLLAASAEQLMAAQRRDPSDPANEYFEKRLRLAARRRPARASGQPVPSDMSSRDELEELEELDELDELVRSLPADMVEQFTKTIQPLLINSCGGGTCHGANTDTQFHLMSPVRSSTLPRRFTQKNLQAALEHVDPVQPSRSPLLQMATEPHGQSNDAPLTDKDVTQLGHLAAWVLRTHPKPQATSRTVPQPPDSSSPQPIAQHASLSLESVPMQEPLNANAGPLPPDAPNDGKVQPAGHLEPVDKTDAKEHDSGVDPFDPEIFNRRYLK